MKTCSRCKIEKDIDDFYKKSLSKDGYRSECKDCSDKYTQENKESIKEYRKKRYESVKDTNDFKEMRKKWYQLNKDSQLEKNKKWRKENKEQILSNKKDYYELNKDEILSKRKEYYKRIKNDSNASEKLKERSRINTKKWRDENKELLSQRIKERKTTDPVYKLVDSIRTLIWISIKKMGFDKNGRTEDILGCNFDLFMKHIEEQFKEGMTWENHGQWHLDHKKPISWAKSEEEVYELNHYTNFQPLWASENLTKNNKWSDE